ncbi:MAG: type II secretion system secretin GspD [Deltaproteobacteria bacterium]|nr:type II secretion system secretin GspD [Deltaproteobacteria bacterium]
MPRLRRPVTLLAIVMGLWCSLAPLAAAQPAKPAVPPPAPAAPAEAEPAEADDDQAADDGRNIQMDFQDVDLGVLVKFISEITHKNFIVDEKVKGKITIISPAKISVDEAYLVFQSVLQVKGFTTVPSGSVIKIVPTKDAKSSTLRTIVPKGGVSPSDEFITRLVPLTHVDANNMVAILQPLVSPDGLLTAYSPTNTLILIDTAAQTARLIKILAELDVEGQERGIEVLRLNYVFATDIAQTLAQVLDEGQQAGQNPAAPAPVPAPAAGRAARAGGGGQASVSGGAPGRAFKIIPDERTNSLIVLAGVLEMRRIKDIVARLDVPLPLGNSRIHVYYLKYANAVELLQVLSTMVNGGGGLAAAGLSSGRGGRGGLGGVGSRGGRGGGLGGGGGGFGGGGLGGGGLGGGFGGGGLGGGGLGGARLGGLGGGNSLFPAGQAGALGGTPLVSGQPFGAAIGGQQVEAIRMTADPQTNSVIINASPQDYETIKEVIEKLDVRRRQVYIEAIILEVRLEKARSLGFDFQGGTALGSSGIGIGRTNLSDNLNQFAANPGSIQGLLLAAVSNQTVRLPNGTVVPAQQALFTALQSDDDVNVLSAPNLLTTDNQEAEIVVGQNVPFVASRSTSETNLSNQFATVERRDVGITLRFTPQISEGGTVRLDIFEEVSAIIPTSQAETLTVGPTTTIRSASTTVVSRDNQTIVIGGLISDDITQRRSGIPFVSNIPVLGNLLRNTSSMREKVNLIIFLTPHIVRNEADQRKESLQQRDRIKAFMEEQHIPNKRSDMLDTPGWDTLPAPAEGGEKKQSAPPPPPDAGASEASSLPPPAPVRYVLLASFSEQGQPPPILAAPNGLLAVAVPAESELRSLFVHGRDVRFESDTYSALYHCLDTFSTREQAMAVYPEGLPVGGEPRELLHWRDIATDASARNVHAWTKVN